MSPQDFEASFSEEAQTNNFHPEMQDLHMTQYSDWNDYNVVALDSLAMRERQYQPYPDIETDYSSYPAANATFLSSSSALPHGEWGWQPVSEALEPSFEPADETGLTRYPQLLMKGPGAEIDIQGAESSADNQHNTHGQHDPNARQQNEKVKQDVKNMEGFIMETRVVILDLERRVKDMVGKVTEFEACSASQQPERGQYQRGKGTKELPQPRKKV